MKKVLIVLLAVFMLFGTAMAAEGKQQTADNIVSINVLPYFIGLFNAGYERKIMNMASIRVRGSYWPFASAVSDGDWQVFTLGGDIHFWLQGTACKGWFLGPKFDAFISSTNIEGTNVGATSMMLGAHVGHHWVFEGGFAMSLSFGGWTNIASSVSSDDETIEVTPIFEGTFMPTVDFTVGYAF